MKIKIALFLVISLIILYITYPKTTYQEVDVFNAEDKEVIQIMLTGEVVYPGTYEFVKSISLMELLEIAGGLLPSADVSGLELSEVITKTKKVMIPKKQEAIDLRININEASIETLLTIPYIREQMAVDIHNYIRNNGFFITYEELLNIKNIGPATLEKIKPYIRFN